MSGNDVITLSSDDEEVTPIKRVKLITLETKLDKSNPQTLNNEATPVKDSCIVLSDDEEPTVDSSDTKCAVDISEEAAESPDCDINNGDRSNTHISQLFRDFLSQCIANMKHPEYRQAAKKKLVSFHDKFDKYIQLTHDYTPFRQILLESFDKLESDPKLSLAHFTDVFQNLNAQLQEIERDNSEHKERLKKLERVLSKLKKRIDELEEGEIDFDDEENSSYLQLARYKQRATQVYSKICKLRKVNQYSGRLTYQRLNFKDSTYPEINEAINKKYKNKTVFPTYHEIEKVVRGCVSEHKHIVMDDVDLGIESKQCFVKLGNHIQRQRKLELYSMHMQYLDDALDDPAKDNPALQGELLSSYGEKVKKESAIIDKFATMQEKGVKCDESEEGSVADSDSDHNENDGGEANDTKAIECITID